MTSYSEARRSGVGGRAGLELPLEAPDLLTGQPEFLNDRVLRNVLAAGIAYRPAKVKAGAFHELAGIFLSLFVCLASGNDISHRVRHPFMFSRLAYQK
ncbi:hypothetical protein ACIBHX_01690 [Nonomuraea sp. NPDC050536]|uniref:hypothetical protein n=1 Tax=Nonomuraea sp. NPDC050536 TaxID=3364366 RepID=UPI0037C59CFA